MISCVVVFDGRITRVFLWRHTTVVARIPCKIWSDRGRSFEKFISKLRNSRRNGMIDLSCISVWDGTDTYSCQQIVACPSSKSFVKPLRIGFSKIIRIYPGCSIAFCCLIVYSIWLRNISRKWFVTTVSNLLTHVLQLHRILYGFSAMIQKQFFRLFHLFAPEVKYFYEKNTRKNSQIIFIWWKWFKTWNNFGK